MSALDFVMPDLDEMKEGNENISPLVSEIEIYRLREMVDLTTLDVTQRQNMLTLINQVKTQDEYAGLAKALKLNLILDRDRIVMGLNFGSGDIKKRLRLVLAHWEPEFAAMVVTGDVLPTQTRTMKVIISGGRHFTDYELLKNKCDQILSKVTEPIEIVSGRCDRGTLTWTTPEGIEVFGADGLGEKYAAEKGYHVAPFPADWDAHGLSAGPIRNKVMAEYGEALISFWDGESRGTEDMIREANRKGLKVRIVKY